MGFGRSVRAGIEGSYRAVLPGRLPDWIIVGQQKAGTTTLHVELHRCPQTVRPSRKGLSFFSYRWDEGVDWYRAQFTRFPGWKTGEATSHYLFHPDAMTRMATVIPDAFVVVLLREPVERAYSHWSHERSKGREPLAFSEAIAAEDERLRDADPRDPDSAFRRHSYVRRGMYADQLERVYSLYPRDRVVVVTSDDLFARPRDVLTDVAGRLGVRPHRREIRARNVGRSRPPIDQDTLEHLTSRFAEQNARVYDLIERDLGW